VDFAGDDAGRRLQQQAHDSERGDALPGPGLADDAEDFALLKETSSTAVTSPRHVANAVVRLVTERRGIRRRKEAESGTPLPSR
jgi:hypothetical protein